MLFVVVVPVVRRRLSERRQGSGPPPEGSSAESWISTAVAASVVGFSVGVRQRSQRLRPLQVRGELHRPDLAVEEELVRGYHRRRRRRGVPVAGEPCGEFELGVGGRRGCGES